MNKKNGSTVCPKAGIKIHETPTQGNQNSNISKNISFHKTTLSELDLNIDNYTLNDLYNLFNIPSQNGIILVSSFHLQSSLCKMVFSPKPSVMRKALSSTYQTHACDNFFCVP